MGDCDGGAAAPRQDARPHVRPGGLRPLCTASVQALLCCPNDGHCTAVCVVASSRRACCRAPSRIISHALRLAGQQSGVPAPCSVFPGWRLPRTCKARHLPVWLLALCAAPCVLQMLGRVALPYPTHWLSCASLCMALRRPGARRSVPDECCAKSSALIYHCMELEPAQRPTAKEVAMRLHELCLQNGVPDA